MNRTHHYLFALTCGLLCLLSACKRQEKPVEPATPCPTATQQPVEAGKPAAPELAIHHIKTPQEFEALLKKGKPVILKVSATWCGPCRYMAPLYAREANKYCGSIIFTAMDADEKGLETLISRYASRGFPTFNFFDKSGKLVKDHPGSYPEDEFAAEIKAFVEKYS